MKFRWLITFFLLLFSIPIFASEELEVVKRMEQSGSGDRILALSTYCDENVFSKGRTREKFHFLLTEGYRIAKQDPEFRDYLDFYSRMQDLMFIPVKDLDKSELIVLNFWTKALHYYESTGDKRFVAICHAQIGESNFLLKRYAESIESLLKAKELFEKIGYHKFPVMGRYLHQMALIFYFFREYGKVVELMEISIQLPPYNKNYDIQRYNTLGAAYKHLKQTWRAEKAFFRTIQTAVAYKENIWIALASGYLADLYVEQGKYQNALPLYESTLGYTEELKDIFIKEHSEHLLGIAKVHILLKQLPQARKYLEKINYRDVASTREKHIFGKAHQDINYWLKYYDVQHKFHLASKNYHNAYLYTDSTYKFRYLIDSTFNRLQVEVVQNKIEVQKQQYESEERELLVKTQNQLLIFFIILVLVVIASSLLLFSQNRKVRAKNDVISLQMNALQKVLEQKQVLLSELQHRVKNNLQHVISILEIQKESIDFNNIDEVIRGNQNRIHSMALLHKKLNISDHVNSVNLKNYVSELAELVKESYDSKHKNIKLNVGCEIRELSIEKALPLGLIIVELVSNSMKHAFNKKHQGIIDINLTKENDLQDNKLLYADNGVGFDFENYKGKGLGMEIITGLIDQLDANIYTRGNNGFEVNLYFG